MKARALKIVLKKSDPWISDSLLEKCQQHTDELPEISGATEFIGLLYRGLSLKEINRRIIQQCLQDNSYNVLKTASILEIGKTKLYELIASGELQINPKS